jgi:outer membrane lipoprotein-sorting protein
MLKIILKRLLTTAFVMSLVQVASAQTADQIVEKHLEALGGRAALEKIQSRTTKGTISVSTPAGELSGSIETLNQRPNKTRTLIQLDLSALGLGKMTQDQRFDGTSGYAMDTLQGNREITGDPLEAMKNGSFPNPLLNYKELGVTIELAGKEKVGDRDAYVLLNKPKSGPTSRQYIDAESYLPLKQVVKINVPQIGGEVEQTTELFDFKDVDGIKVPFRVKTTSAIQTVMVVISQVEHNKPIDASLFSKPAAEKQ